MATSGNECENKCKPQGSIGGVRQGTRVGNQAQGCDKCVESEALPFFGSKLKQIQKAL